MVHPFAVLEGTSLWAIVESAVSELVLNNDLVENTARAYIVGHLPRHRQCEATGGDPALGVVIQKPTLWATREFKEGDLSRCESD